MTAINFVCGGPKNNSSNITANECAIIQDSKLNSVNWRLNEGTTQTGSYRTRVINGTKYPATGPLRSLSGNGYLYMSSDNQPAGAASR